MSTEASIRIGDREELVFMLAEAAAIEHNVMACYLYGIWSLKRGERDGLTPEQAKIVAAWKQHLTLVAVEEMTHLTLVGNLMAAIGASPHLSRPNFPIPAGYHPAAIDLELVGFSHALIDHAIFLERPEGVEMSDAPEFVRPDDYDRTPPKGVIMPSAQDYSTIGHLYRGIYHGFEVLTRRYGAENLFCGDVADQIGPVDAPLPGLMLVTDLASAHLAIETIVEQGEGAPAHSADSHYQKFLEVKAEYEEMLKNDPAFSPAFPVARNPVMRRPRNAQDRVWITNPEAVKVLDLANSLYNLMLRFIAQGYGHEASGPDNKHLFVRLGREMMWLLSPVCEHLASLPAGDDYPGINAGMSFTILRDVVRLPAGRGGLRFLSERMLEIAEHAGRVFASDHELASVAPKLRELAEKLAVPDISAKPAPKAPPKAPIVDDRPGPASTATGTKPSIVEKADGKDMVLSFDLRRCIHSRRCVLNAPNVFLANVKGQWLFPDAMPTADLRGVCHTCPSGAITYEPKGDTPPEPAPTVNVAELRENGPYAFRAILMMDGKPDGYRATLCRCGASKNKPYCDGTHKLIDFRATGEPDTHDSEPLVARGGELHIAPQHNGPLEVSGNLEITSGTGRTIDRVTRARLCRCGASSNKPFCDNTHLKIGFKSD